MTTFKINHLEYTTTAKVEKELESLIYWLFEERMANVDLRQAELYNRTYSKRYTDTYMNNLRYEIDRASDTVKWIFDKLDDLKVPYWVQNEAIYWESTHDVRKYSIKEFFTQSRCIIAA